LISGNSAIEGAGKLESVGLKVTDIVVLIDHERGVKDRLRSHGYTAHAVITLSEIPHTLHDTGHISTHQLDALLADHAVAP
jgi:uridine monophosphate synthetase